MTAYYNENDPKAAAWLRELIKGGHIAPGVVDERSIEDVIPNELSQYTQCHFFAGIGGWSYGLRLAGWPDDKPVWTGSCPCQPFSTAGRGAGFADERHLWPSWFHLISECQPVRVFGEQVANALSWLDLISTDLEAKGYAVGAVIVGAHSVGAPHIRQRLCWVADSVSKRLEGQRLCLQPGPSRFGDTEAGWRSEVGELGDANEQGSQGRGERWDGTDQRVAWPPGMAVEWINCTDGKARPVEPLAQQMANGLSFAMGLVRGFSHAEKEALTNAANSTGFTTEVLRQMRDGVCPAEIWSATGRCVGFPETSILLAFLCEQSRELGRFFYGQTSGSAQEREAAMRAVQKIWSSARTPQGREFFEQCAVEFGNTMPALPQESALLAAFNGFLLSTGVPGRVGLLRGYGNAIVPQVAAAFVESYLSIE